MTTDEQEFDEEETPSVEQHYEVHFALTMHLYVPVKATSEDDAMDKVSDLAEEYLDRVTSYTEATDDGCMYVIASLDGIGAEDARVIDENERN